MELEFSLKNKYFTGHSSIYPLVVNRPALIQTVELTQGFTKREDNILAY
jgi:hypothetical protein